MDLTMIAKFLSKNYGKLCYANETFAKCVAEWTMWYKGYDPKFHTVTSSNGITRPKRELYRLNMGKRVSEDWASIILNEDIDIVVNSSSKKSSVFVQGTKGNGGVLGTNGFQDIISRSLELMFALGTSAIVLDLENISVEERTGKIIKTENTKIKLTPYSALQIIPITWSVSGITEAAFVSEFYVKGKTYYLVSSHMLENGVYVIRNDVLSDSYEKASLETTILPYVNTMSPNPLFYFFKTNIVNNIDLSSPFGVSIFADALSVLRGVDSCYDACVREVQSGQRIVMMNKNLLTTDQDGNPVVPQDVKETYMQFFGDEAGQGMDNFIKEFNPTLRTNDLDSELQNQLNMLSSKCGLGTRFYNFNFSSGVTATEYVGERNDMFRNAHKMSRYVEGVLKQMVQGILWVGANIMGANVDSNAKVVITVSDGVIESDSEKREQDRKDVEMGIMSKEEYRMKWYGETLEDATSAIASISGIGLSPASDFA